MPNWVYRRAINFYDDGNTKLILIGDGVARYSADQFAEYMLCEACEARFSAWERRAAAVSLQLDDSDKEKFPALEAAYARTLFTKVRPDVTGASRFADISAVDHDALARFALSVIWRAHTSRDHFHKVRLGSYGDALGTFLLDDSKPALPNWAQVTLTLIEPAGAPLDRIVMPPWSARSADGHRVHCVVLFGLWFQVHIGQDVPAFLRECCLARAGYAWVSNGAPLVDGVKGLRATVKSVGSLARDERAGKV